MPAQLAPAAGTSVYHAQLNSFGAVGGGDTASFCDPGLGLYPGLSSQACLGLVAVLQPAVAAGAAHSPGALPMFDSAVSQCTIMGVRQARRCVAIML